MLPEVPTTQEAGFGAFHSINWFGVFAPSGLPAPVAQAIVAALRQALQDPDVQRIIAVAEPVANTPAGFAA